MRYTATIIAVLILIGCSRDAKNYISLSDCKFESVFGKCNNDSTQVFWLVTSGWRYGGYKEDSFINSWIKVHSTASIYPILSMADQKTKGSQIVCCWVMDK